MSTNIPPDFGRARIILLGDSITQLSFSSPNGFGAHLADVYQRRADVFNRGYSGYNTKWILELLSTEKGRYDIFGPAQTKNVVDGSDSSSSIPGNAVRLVVIFLGANDASCSILNTRQHVPIEAYQESLKSIFGIAKEHCPHAKFILVAPPPIHREGRLKYQVERYGVHKATGELERTLDLSLQYASAAESVAKGLGVPCLNVWNEMQEAAPEPLWHAYLSDGLHLSPSGNEFVGKRLVEIIEQYYPELAVKPCSVGGLYANSESECQIRQQGPWHDDILDPQNYRHVFQNK